MSAVCKLQASSPASESLGSPLILPWLNTISLLITSIRCLLWNTREGQERLNLPRQGWQSSRQLNTAPESAQGPLGHTCPFHHLTAHPNSLPALCQHPSEVERGKSLEPNTKSGTLDLLGE